MSIDDDGWEVEEALKGKPEAENFDRFLKWTYDLSEQNEKLIKELTVLHSAVKLLIPDGYKMVKENDKS